MFFIADVGSCHNGSLERAKELIRLSKKVGANACKFQSWKTDKFISNVVFEKLKDIVKKSHQGKWDISPYETYKKYELPLDWIPELKTECDKNNIEFMCSVYTLENLNHIDQFVNIHKIGSGKITDYKFLELTAKKNKPILLATGASTIEEVINAVNIIEKYNKNIVIMQCNTCYDSNRDNENQVNLNVLKSYKTYFQNYGIGLSDHTKDLSIIQEAITLGASFIERHITDGQNNSPDNSFALSEIEWIYMVNNCIDTLKHLGNTYKTVTQNELETRILQRECLMANKDLSKDHILTDDDIISMRPCPQDGVPPFINLVGMKLLRPLKKHDYFRAELLAVKK